MRKRLVKGPYTDETDMTQTASPNSEEQSLIDSVSDPGPGVEVLNQIDPLAEDPDPDDPGPGPGPAPSPSPSQDDPLPPAATKADTRDRILDVALDLFIDQGFDGTSL